MHGPIQHSVLHGKGVKLAVEFWDQYSGGGCFFDPMIGEGLQEDGVRAGDNSSGVSDMVAWGFEDVQLLPKVRKEGLSSDAKDFVLIDKRAGPFNDEP
ncbi:hypothetical protein ACOSP7_013292 [Xanthoceras sorbifolium]